MLSKLQVCLLYRRLSDTSEFGKKFLVWNSFDHLLFVNSV